VSLKAFHVAFIVLSTTLSLGFGLWAFDRLDPDSGLRLLFGIGGLLTAAGLLAYGGWFLRKMQDVSYL